MPRLVVPELPDAIGSGTSDRGLAEEHKKDATRGPGRLEADRSRLEHDRRGFDA